MELICKWSVIRLTIKKDMNIRAISYFVSHSVEHGFNKIIFGALDFVLKVILLKIFVRINFIEKDLH